MDINQIKKPINDELEVFEKTFKEVVKSNVSLLDIVTRYIVKSKGKQMRPMFVFLTAKMMGESNGSTQRAAALIDCCIQQHWYMMMLWTIRIVGVVISLSMLCGKIKWQF